MGGVSRGKSQMAIKMRARICPSGCILLGERSLETLGRDEGSTHGKSYEGPHGDLWK